MNNRETLLTHYNYLLLRRKMCLHFQKMLNVVSKSMECLQFLCCQCSNQSSGGVVDNINDSRLVYIRKRSKELVTFFGLVRIN